MRVLLVNHLLDAISGGGTAERTYQLARFLALEDVNCSILTLDIGLSSERLAGLGNVRVHALPCINKRFFIPAVCPRRLWKLIADADVIHLAGHWTLLNVLVFWTCRLQRKPFLFSPAGALKPFGRSLWLKHAYNRVMGLALLKCAALNIAITEDERAEFLSHGVQTGRVAVIPNGIDPAQYQVVQLPAECEKFRLHYALGSAPFILFLGRLSHIKGPDLLLEAFSRIAGKYPDHLLVLAGPDDGLADSLRAQARVLGLERRIRFIGYVSGATKVLALRTARLMVIPSRREAMSIVILEAGACSCPVVFTNTCGLSAFEQADAGIMVEADASKIAEGMQCALDDPEKLSRCVERLAELVSNDYLWESQAKRIHVLCKGVIKP